MVSHWYKHSTQNHKIRALNLIDGSRRKKLVKNSYKTMRLCHISTVVKQSTHNPEIKILNLTNSSQKEKMTKRFRMKMRLFPRNKFNS